MTAEYDAVQIDAEILFEREPCRCCDCCEGYCPDQEGDRWEAFVEVEIAEQEYVGTRMLIIRRDRLNGLPGDLKAMKVPAQTKVGTFVIPEALPPVFGGRHVASHYDRIDRAGLICRHVEGEPMVHLYVGDEHVGWTRHATEGKGVTLDELAVVRRIAKASWLSINRAAGVYAEVQNLSIGQLGRECICPHIDGYRIRARGCAVHAERDDAYWQGVGPTQEQHMGQMLYRLPRDGQTDDMKASIESMLTDLRAMAFRPGNPDGSTS